MQTELKTERLMLRPLRPGDAARVQELCGNLNVARSLARVPHPYPNGRAEAWIAQQASDWAGGKAYIFAIVLGRDLIGVVGLEDRGKACFEIGYWLGEPWWGQGYMSEAVARVLAFAFDELRLDELKSGYFDGNSASRRIQDKFGFQVTGHRKVPCLARGADLAHVDTALLAEAWREARRA